MSQHVIDSIVKHQCVQEWSQYYEKRFDGLLYGLIGPSGPMASHVSEDSLEQVRPHLVCHLVYSLYHGFHQPSHGEKAKVKSARLTSSTVKSPAVISLDHVTVCLHFLCCQFFNGNSD